MDRLDLSRQVLDAWEVMGGPSGTEGNLRLIQNEIEILKRFAKEHGDRRQEAEALIERYAFLSRAIKTALN